MAGSFHNLGLVLLSYLTSAHPMMQWRERDYPLLPRTAFCSAPAHEPKKRVLTKSRCQEGLYTSLAFQCRSHGRLPGCQLTTREQPQQV